MVFVSFPSAALFLSSLRHPGASLLASVPLPWWPPPLGAPSSLSWPGLHVPVSPGACVWVGMGVSLEKSLSASSLQLQAGCHGNRVRGPPLQQLSCGLGEGWGPAGQRAPQGPQSPWRARTPGVAPCLLICGPQTHTSASQVLVQALLAPVTLPLGLL